MYTKTITLSGEALSSFLAAGGQTVNPNAPNVAAAATAVGAAAVLPTTSAVAQVAFPTLVETTSAAAVAQTSAAGRAGILVITTSALAKTTSVVPTTSSVLKTTTSLASTTTSSALPTTSASKTTSAAVTSAAKASSRAVASAVRSASVRSASADALSSAKKSGSSGIGGGGIAGIIIGLMIVFAIAGALLFFWRKRRNERREEEYAEKSRRDARNEKGMVRLEEEEISTPTSGGGFDFGHLPPIVSNPPVLNDNTTFTRSASPAQMQQGAAVLGIQRPFTPPPGHPAHPNYRQPPALVANRQIPSQGVRSITPNMPRKPVQASSAPMQRKLSSNNPFNDPPMPSTDVAPIPARAISPPPVRVSSPPIIPMPTSINEAADPRASVASFTAGDDSGHEEEGDVVAPLSAAVSPKSFSPVPAAMPMAAISAPTSDQTAPSEPQQPAESTSTEDDSVIRSKSVQRASDNWAARKAHLKNTLALQTASNPTSPAAEQSPFADPAPTIDHEIASVSPMQMNFDRNSQKF